MDSNRKSVYIESTIPSYATARISRDILKANRQTATRIFWEDERQKYDLFTSDYVIEECSAGDPEAARRRLEFLQGINIIPRSDSIDALAEVYFNMFTIPVRAKTDCFHLAACVVYRINCLLTWNCAHFSKRTYEKMIVYNQQHGLWVPLLNTPDSFMLEEGGRK